MMSLPSSYRYRKTKRTRMNHLVECLSPKIVALRRLLILRNPKPPSEGASECGPSGIEKPTSDMANGEWRMANGEWERLMPLIPAAKRAPNIREAINAIPQFSAGWTAECELGTIAFGFARRHGV